jgi:hypothetical protein
MLAMSVAGFACGDDGPDLCDAEDDARSSFETLVSINVIQEGTNAVRDAAADLRADLETLSEAAQDEFTPQVADLRSSLDAVNAAVTQTEGQSLPDRARQIGDAMNGLRTSAAALFDAVDTRCE